MAHASDFTPESHAPTASTKRMERNDIEEHVVSVIAKQLEVDKAFLLPTTRLREDLSASSLDHVEIFITLERDLNIFISDEEASAISTIADLTDLTFRKVSE